MLRDITISAKLNRALIPCIRRKPEPLTAEKRIVKFDVEGLCRREGDVDDSYGGGKETGEETAGGA